MIRVLHFAGIINRHDFIDTILAHLDRRRFEISALTAIPPRRMEPYVPSEAYETRCLHVPLARASYPTLFRELVREIRRVRPHIVHAHHYDEGLLASLAVRLLRSPALVLGHHYSDHIYYLSRGLRRRAHLSIEAFTNRAAARIVVPAQEVYRILVDRQGEPASKVEVIPYGLPFEQYRPSSAEAPSRLRHQLGLEGKWMVLACCRLNREKGLEYLLRAMPQVLARHPEAALVMVGDGTYAEPLKALARQLGLESSVSFVGWRADALDWMAAADVVVQPSLCESYCQVLVEALAFCKPVVMTPVGAGPEIIGDNERGRLVPLADAEAISDALIELANDRTLGPQLGAAGHRFIREHMPVDAIVRRHERLYEEVVAESSHGGLRATA
jgi:glycosyltransferase involved in cell wall biosynthesis